VARSQEEWPRAPGRGLDHQQPDPRGQDPLARPPLRGVHEPLVDELTFQRAEVILRERGDDISRRRGNASDFLLSGVVRCVGSGVRH
jgi:hypothetical protein